MLPVDKITFLHDISTENVQTMSVRCILWNQVSEWLFAIVVLAFTEIFPVQNRSDGTVFRRDGAELNYSVCLHY